MASMKLEEEWKAARKWLRVVSFIDMFAFVLWGAAFGFVIAGKRCPSGGEHKGYGGWSVPFLLLPPFMGQTPTLTHCLGARLITHRPPVHVYYVSRLLLASFSMLRIFMPARLLHGRECDLIFHPRCLMVNPVMTHLDILHIFISCLCSLCYLYHTTVSSLVFALLLIHDHDPCNDFTNLCPVSY